MNPRTRSFLVPALIALGATLLYLPQLRDAPFYLGRDEMFFGLTAHSLASTGQDANGRFMPLYIQSPMRYGSEMWFQPMLMYSTAISVKLFGLSEGTIRLPMALAGIVDVVLVYFIGRLLFRRELPAIAAAILMAFTPAHFINSRVAMDFQAPLPFILGWLLCALMYLERGKPAWLFGAGLMLGMGLYTYIASYMLMPAYVVLTGLVLFWRGEQWQRYGLLAAGFAIPALCCVPFLLQNPTVIRDVMWHYDREQPQTAGGLALLLTYFNYQRFADAAAVYGRFWGLRFLFINGPQALWVAGAFLLPTAGLLIAGLLAMLRRREPQSVLLVGGLLSAAIPASLVGDLDAIHRAAAVLPFGVLIAVVGLDSLWTATSPIGKGITFLTMWAIAIGLATGFHGQLPLAQAVVRAATVPLAVALLLALWLVWAGAAEARARRPHLALVALAALASIQMAYVVAGYAATAWISAALLAAVVLAVLLEAVALGSPARQALVVVALTVAASHFTYAHAEYSYIRRVQFIPATAIVLAARCVYAAAGLAAIAGALWLLRPAAARRMGRGLAAVLMTVTIVMIQAAYFHIDYFSDPRIRLIQALVVLATGVAVVALLIRSAAESRFILGHLAAAAVLGLASIQFTYFYVDYFTRYREQAGQFDTEGNARIAWEAVIERARHRFIPAIYMGNVGPYGFSDLYWQFYAFKHDRADLLPRTIAEAGFDAGRVRGLPDGSLVVTSPSPATDETIDGMVASGELRSKTLLTAPDGMSKFWLLETRGGGS